MKKLLIIMAFTVYVIIIFGATLLYSQRIYVEDAILKLDGNPIWINGVNTPWDKWNDFGGNYNHSFWDAEFGRIKAAGGNATRIWITCSGEIGINIDLNGYISGATRKHWNDLNDMLQLAKKHQIYILATLISFDHTKNTYTTYQRWRKMYASKSNVNSFVVNYVIPFVNRFKDNPYLFAIEPCNEIEWVNQNSDNARFSWSTLQHFSARVVAAVHKNSKILTTVGNNMKWQTDTWPGNEGNQFSDGNLKLQYNDPGAYIDFYSPHFYQWVVRWYGNPFKSAHVSEYGLTDKPVVIAEMPAKGISSISIVDCYKNARLNGFQGVMAWTSNGIDRNGNLRTGLGDALTAIKKDLK